MTKINIIASPINSEYSVYVSRATSGFIFNSINVGERPLFITGPCGSGKSTYAIVNYMSRSKGTYVIVQPDLATASVAKANLKDVVSKLRADVQYAVTDARTTWLNIIAGRVQASKTCFVIDEAHTRNHFHQALIEWVRAKCPRYVLITATPSGVHSDASSLVAVDTVVNASADLTVLVGLKEPDGTVWDPANWRGMRRMVTYPVTSPIASKLTRWYRGRGFVVYTASVINHRAVTNALRRMRDSTKKTVLLLMPGIGDGLTVPADILIDTGHTMRVDCDRFLSVPRAKRLTKSETQQRWARVGRHSSAIVITSGASCVSDASGDMVYCYACASVVLAAVGLVSRRLQSSLPERLRGFSSVGVTAARDAVRSGASDLLLAAMRSLRDPGKLANTFSLYDLGEFMLPAPYLALHVNSPFDAGRSLYEIAPESDLSFERAVNIVKRNPRRYAYSIVPLVFGRSGTFRHELDLPAHINGLLSSIIGVVDAVTYLLIRAVLEIKHDNGRYYYDNKYAVDHKGRKAALIDRKDLRTERPQTNFARVVDWMRHMKIVSVPSDVMQSVNHNYLKAARVGEARNPGPNHRTLASRLRSWSSGTNSTVVIKLITNGHEMPALKGWSDLDKAFKDASRSVMREMAHVCVIAYCEVSRASDTVLTRDGLSKHIRLVGFTLHYPSTIKHDLDYAVMRYTNFYGKVEEIETLMYDSPTDRCEPQLMSNSPSIYHCDEPRDYSRVRCAASRIWRYAVANKLPVMFTDDQEVECVPLADFARTHSMIKSKVKKPHTRACFLLVVFEAVHEDEADGSKILCEDGPDEFFNVIGFALMDMCHTMTSAAVMTYVDHLGARRVFDVEYSSFVVDPTVNALGRWGCIDDYVRNNNPMGGASSFGADVKQGAFSHLSGSRIGEASNPGPVIKQGTFSYLSGARVGEASNPGPMDNGLPPVLPDFPTSTTEATVPRNDRDDDDASSEGTAIDVRTGQIIPGRRRRRRIAPTALNAQITSDGTGDFSPIECEKIYSVERKYDEGSYFINLTFFAINTDGSFRVDLNTAVSMVTSSGGVLNTTWRMVFADMEHLLQEGRFTLRRYFRMRAATMRMYFLEAPALIEWFNSEECTLSRRFGKDPERCITSMSWAQHIILDQNRADIATFNRTRQIEVNAAYHGDISGFSRREVLPTSSGPANVEEVEKNI